jgi:hypothetical protein
MGKPARLTLLVVLLSVQPLAAEERMTQDLSFLKDPEKIQLIHQHFSASCFNAGWDLIDKKDRTPQDTENMLLLSYASLWHWKQRTDCTPVNLSIAYWQASRVNSLAGQGSIAKLFGERCLDISVKNKLAPFYLGYAYEALAFAEIVNRRSDQARGHLAVAKGELAKVTDKDEKDLLGADLAKLDRMLPAK